MALHHVADTAALLRDLPPRCTPADALRWWTCTQEDGSFTAKRRQGRAALRFCPEAPAGAGRAGRVDGHRVQRHPAGCSTAMGGLSAVPDDRRKPGLALPGISIWPLRQNNWFARMCRTFAFFPPGDAKVDNILHTIGNTPHAHQPPVWPGCQRAGDSPSAATRRASIKDRTPAAIAQKNRRFEARRHHHLSPTTNTGDRYPSIEGFKLILVMPAHEHRAPHHSMPCGGQVTRRQQGSRHRWHETARRRQLGCAQFRYPSNVEVGLQHHLAGDVVAYWPTFPGTTDASHGTWLTALATITSQRVLGPYHHEGVPVQIALVSGTSPAVPAARPGRSGSVPGDTWTPACSFA